MSSHGMSLQSPRSAYTLSRYALLLDGILCCTNVAGDYLKPKVLSLLLHQNFLQIRLYQPLARIPVMKTSSIATGYLLQS